MKRIASVALFFIFLPPVFSDVFLFEVKKGDDQALVEWRTRRYADGRIELTSRNALENVSHHLLCDAAYNTLRWSFRKQSQNTDYTVTRKGDVLYYEGVIKGESVKREERCEGLKWYQFHALSLPQYLDSDFDDIKFISIRPDDGKLFQLSAKSGGRETIKVNGESVQAIRVDVYLCGLLSRFGHVSYWFRVQDGIFVKYEGITGFPGSTPVTYELLETEA